MLYNKALYYSEYSFVLPSPLPSPLHKDLNDPFHYDNNPTVEVDVYIIDTGIYLEHEDFGGRAEWGADLTTNGTNTTCNEQTCMTHPPDAFSIQNSNLLVCLPPLIKIQPPRTLTFTSLVSPLT